MIAYWEIAAYSAYDMFFKHKYHIVNLVFPISVFGVGISFRLRLFPGHCLLVPPPLFFERRLC